MLAYLSVRGQARRDELMGILWGETPEDNARNAFRQSLHRLRTVLGSQILLQDRDHVGLAGDDLIRVDRTAFLGACEAGRWDQAVEMYGGEFLEGLEVGEVAFDRWADGERVRLRSKFQQALLAASKAATANGRVRDALRFAERLTAVAPYDEDAAIFQANTLVAAGKSSEALAAALQFTARLRDELAVEDSPGIRGLIERLQKRAKQDAAMPAPGTHGAAPTVDFVGRESELSRMLGCVAELGNERGATILVEGDAGIGKSRLLDEFSQRARNLGNVLIFRGREVPTGGGVPYIGVTEALRPIVRAPGISGASRHLLAEAARLWPELRDSFDLPPVAPIEDDAGRVALFEGIAALIDAVAYERSVCLLIDDAQHASISTLNLLTYLARRLHDSPVLLVVAFRADRHVLQTVERLRTLASDDGSDVRIMLDALSLDETKALVGGVLRNSGVGVPPTVERIARSANGSPFVALDLARRAAAGDAPSESPAPLRDILWARLQAAPPSQRRVFFAASLFERSSSLRLLAAAAHLPESATLEAAQELAHAGLLRPAGDGYVVAHDCALSFLVETSGLAGRALLASWAADALQNEPGHADPELATLYALAGRGPEAFAHARAGAFAAAALGASAEVGRLLSIALTFSADERERREIESLLAAFGRGRLALPGMVEPTVAGNGATESTDAPAEPPASSPPTPPGPAPAQPTASARVRGATARQWVVSVAISLLLATLGVLGRRALSARGAERVVSDTLVLLERDARGRSTLEIAAGASKGSPALIPAPVSFRGPAWIDSLPSSWTSPLISPTGGHVAIGRMTPHGQDLIVISADRRDTIPIAAGGGDNLAMGWSPDGRAILFTRQRILRDGGLDSDLYLKWIGGSLPIVPLDTSPVHAVTEASWSPDGARILWVALAAASRQRDIFVSRADGSETRNLTANAADDYHGVWSPDGAFLAFTSSRAGGSRLYVYGLADNRLWPISDRADEDYAKFSPDGRMIAFASARDGDLAVYVRSTLGGTPRRVTPALRQFSLREWRGPRGSFVDRLRIVGVSALGASDSATLTLVGLSADGSAVPPGAVRWTALDTRVIRPLNGNPLEASAFRVLGRAVGNALVIASIPGWRADTLALAVSPTQSIDVSDAFANSVIDSRWLSLGEPRPYVARAPGAPAHALFPNGDLEWESGVLLRSSVQLRPGLQTGVRVFAPFDGRPSPAILSIAFVPATGEGQINGTAPRFVPLMGVQWDGASGNFIYSVGQQTFTDRPGPGGNSTSRFLEISIDDAQTVSFRVDGEVRWRTSMAFLGDVRSSAAQVWLAGRATFGTIALSDFRLTLAARAP